MKLSDALREAQGRGLDLVEVAPTANPPVCKIVSLGKFRYDLSKHDKDKKAGGAKLKEIKFRVNIDEHDYLTKVRHGEEFLERGNKVRVQLQIGKAAGSTWSKWRPLPIRRSAKSFRLENSVTIFPSTTKIKKPAVRS